MHTNIYWQEKVTWINSNCQLAHGGQIQGSAHRDIVNYSMQTYQTLDNDLTSNVLNLRESRTLGAIIEPVVERVVSGCAGVKSALRPVALSAIG